MTQLVPRKAKTPPVAFEGEYLVLYHDTRSALMEQYAKRGPQYEMLAEMAASLFVRTRQMEADGAMDAAAAKIYLQATEALRKLIEQSQRYTEAKRQEIVVHEVNSAVVEVLRIVETLVDPHVFLRIVGAVRAKLQGGL